MTATIDEVAKTLGEFEALAQKTGEWDGAEPVEFSADGVNWLPVWVATDDHPFPPFARATVHRKGVAAPTVMIVAWDESVPADDEWRALWERKPMKLFGSFALRSAIRHAFRDVVGDLRGPDEQDGPTIGAPGANAEPRDWDAEYRAAETVDVLDGIRRDVRTARQNTDQLNALYRERKAQLTAEAWTPRELANLTDTTEENAAELLTEVAAAEPAARPGRAPQDHLPGNRAARRAASKKKGRK